MGVPVAGGLVGMPVGLQSQTPWLEVRISRAMAKVVPDVPFEAVLGKTRRTEF